MQQFKKQYKKLYKAYIKKLKILQNKSFLDSTLKLDYFVTYLKFLRDCHILTEELVIDGIDNYKISVLVAAIGEYELYKNCINNYFYVSKNNIIKKTEEPTEEVQKKYAAEKLLHWNSFWGILCQNIESWCE